jgi:hypothetical protein
MIAFEASCSSASFNHPNSSASDQNTAEVHVEGGKASLVISFAAVPSFEIKTDR